jgi:membrane protein DedA with SNARE-associated domain
MLKPIMIASVVSMIVYALINELFKFLGWFGENNIETQLLHIVIPLVIAIVVIFIVFGLIIKVKRPY